MFIYRKINGETFKIELSEDEIMAILEERQTRLSVDTQFGTLKAAIGGEPNHYPEIFVYLERPDGVEIDLVAAGTEKGSDKMNAYLYSDTSTDEWLEKHSWTAEELNIKTDMQEEDEE